MKQIFPSEMMEDSVQLHYFRHNRSSHLIYISLLLFLALLLFSLPLIKIEVYSSSRGIVRPLRSRQKLVAINSGIIVHSDLINYRYVRKGDTLLSIDNNGIDEQLDLYRRQLYQEREQLVDLAQLLNALSTGGKPQAKTVKYKRLFAEFVLQNNTYLQQANQARSDFERYKRLYERGVLSRAEFEQYQLKSGIALNNWQQFQKQQANSWQADYLLVEKNLREISVKVEQLKKEKAQYHLIAPLDGNLLNVAEVAEGNLIAAGTNVAELSPDMAILADCYINPMDVGFISKQHEVSFMIDTYNYNQWGTVKGKIIEIGEDIEYLDGAPMFKVRCRFNRNHLQLKNGVRGEIKKGMTFTAQFHIARRTLWQLLYDKTDDWLNPKTISRI